MDVWSLFSNIKHKNGLEALLENLDSQTSRDPPTDVSVLGCLECNDVFQHANSKTGLESVTKSIYLDIFLVAFSFCSSTISSCSWTVIFPSSSTIVLSWAKLWSSILVGSPTLSTICSFSFCTLACSCSPLHSRPADVSSLCYDFLLHVTIFCST